jgi:hypothetical protein
MIYDIHIPINKQHVVYDTKYNLHVRVSRLLLSSPVAPEPVTPMMPPIGLKAIVLSSSTIVVTWTDNSLGRSQRITDSRYYTVRYTTLPNHNRRHRAINSTDLNAHIDDLKPDTQYEFAVKVIKGRRESTWSMTVVNATQESGKSMPRRSPVSLLRLTLVVHDNYVVNATQESGERAVCDLVTMVT